MLIIIVSIFVLMMVGVVLMIRLGLFEVKNSSYSINWEEFKGFFKRKK